MSQTEQQSTSTSLPEETGPESGAVAGPTTDTETDLSKDDLFHLLQNERRRAVLRYLEGREEAVRMRDVAEQVAAWEHDTTVEQLGSDERQRVYIALYQTHLSTLDEAGIIEYNKPRGVVTPTPMVDRVVEYLDTSGEPEADAEGEEAWEHRYLGVTVVSSLLLVGTAFNLTVLELVSSFAASVLILAMFSLLTFVKMGAASRD